MKRIDKRKRNLTCKSCGKPHGRSGHAVYCLECAAEKCCVRCAGKLDRASHAKYCAACLPKIATEVYHPKETRRVIRPNWQGAEHEGLKPDVLDWARLAAYIDGEGCINLYPRKGGQYTSSFRGRVVVTNTDFRLVEWCHKTFGMRFYAPAAIPGKRAGREVNWKQCYFAQAVSFKASWILHNCLPYFIIKREQAELVLEHQLSALPDRWQRHPGGKVPQDIQDYRNSLKARISELNKRGTSPAAKGA